MRVSPLKPKLQEHASTAELPGREWESAGHARHEAADVAPSAVEYVPPAQDVPAQGCRIQGSGFGVQGSGCRVQGVGLTAWTAGFRVEGLRVRLWSTRWLRVERVEGGGIGFGVMSLG